MTSPKEIQSLIADIDSILPRVDARRPWSKPSEAARERRVLERVRSYLASQQQQTVVGTPPELSAPAASTQTDVTRQVVQAVAREIEHLRADLLQPLQTDVATLQHERESLIQEIRALERTRQHLDVLPQPHTYEQQKLEEFSQELIRRCTQSLTQQLAHVLTSWETRLANDQSRAMTNTARTAAPDRFDAIMPSPDLEHIQQLQAQSDRMLAALDTNQRAIFEALQRDLQSYQESLSQGLDKMHTLSTQGQMLLSALVENLSQQLGRVTSTLTSPSVQLSGLTPLTSTAPTPPTTPLPSDAFSKTEPTPPASLEGTPIELQPEPLFGQPESSTVPSDALTTSPDSLSGTLSTSDWQVVEGLDSEQLGVEPHQNDDLDAFLQLNLDSQPSLPLVEESITPSRSNSQDLDAWLNQLLGQATTDTASTLPGTGEVPDIEAPDWRTDSSRQEIDELYESLFGTDSLSTPGQPETSQPAVQEQQENLFNPDSIAPLSSQVEDSLFSGLSDPAKETVQTPPPARVEEQWSQSWENLFFQDAASPSSGEASLPGEAPAADAPSHGESVVEQDEIQTISSLTDLFDEMGLSHTLSAIEGSAEPTAPPQLSQEQTLETDLHVTEDDYTPASPDEDLSPAPQQLDIGSDREIQLDLELLRQLQQDFESFEEPRRDRNREIAPQPDLPRDEVEPPSVVPRPEPETQQRPQFLMSNELLAEDWEEFSPYEWSEGDSTGRNLAESATPESVESDFEPDLFPSEALELDHEQAIHITAASPEELAMPGEPALLDDDPFVEMLWDEPTDSLTEEITSSPESRFDSEVVPEQTHDVEPGESGSTEATTPSEAVQEESSHNPPETTASPDASEDVVALPPEAVQDLEQPDAIASKETTSDEHQPSDTLSESPQPDDSSPSGGSD